LVREHDVIYHEDLQIANLVKNHHLANSISDAGWRDFLIILIILIILAFKAASAGKRVVAVDPAFTSQTCSVCGGSPEGVIRPLAYVPGLWDEPTQRSQRRQEQRGARAAPSGTRGVTCGNEPRTHRPLGRAKCQITIR
jgi:hypothetical protein